MDNIELYVSQCTISLSLFLVPLSSKSFLPYFKPHLSCVAFPLVFSWVEMLSSALALISHLTLPFYLISILILYRLGHEGIHAFLMVISGQDFYLFIVLV